MGNEASLEGGEGLAGLPEGVAGAAAAPTGGGADGGATGGAPSQQGLAPAGVEADLSQLSAEERRQIAAVMSRAQQGLPRGNLAGGPPSSAEPPPMPRHAPGGIGGRAGG